MDGEVSDNLTVIQLFILLKAELNTVSDNVSHKIDIVTKHFSAVSEKIQSLEKKNSKLKQDIKHLKRYSRRKSIIVFEANPNSKIFSSSSASSS